MYKKMSIGVAVPAYNEQSLIGKTLSTIPDFVDHIAVINDGSKDDTLQEIKKYAKKDIRIVILDNKKNLGIGGSLKRGLKKLAELDCDLSAIMAGDAQMDPNQLHKMIDDMLERKLDFIKANRFMHLEALESMPKFRRVGNIIVTILTKFATGYYAVFDTQNGYVIYSKKVINDMPWHLIGDRYEFENTILIGLSIINARIGDFSAPSIYGTEKSTIKVIPTTLKVLRVLFKGFWQRIYYKYVLFNFHPIALFVFGSVALGVIGVLGLIYLTGIKIIIGITPTSGTVMLFVLPLIVSIQLGLTAFILDVMEDKKSM
jgi:glycosyltransferase involved in cell wall biosynthesis